MWDADAITPLSDTLVGATEVGRWVRAIVVVVVVVVDERRAASTDVALSCGSRETISRTAGSRRFTRASSEGANFVRAEPSFERSVDAANKRAEPSFNRRPR